MKHWRILAVLVMCAAAAVPALAQMPTGTLTGNVTDGASPLPGVTVTVSSDKLQGTQTAVTSANGDYIFSFLPPGEYIVTFSLSGFQTIEARKRIQAGGSAKLDAEMPMGSLTEEITVTGSFETISTSETNAATYDQSFMEQLPIARTIVSAVGLAAGVHTTGPSDGITISGSQSYENLFMVNGVVVNENLRGQPFDLFIEDAVEETTTSISGISAEFGRFSGGVVNTLTKSGGNELHGSFRTNFTKDSWSALTPLTTDGSQDTTLAKTYEATLGGWIMKDKLWYFLAGRDVSATDTRFTYGTNLPYPHGTSETRYEGKLTFTPATGHRLVGSYLKIEEDETGRAYSNVMDFASLYDRSLPQELAAFHYTGVITDNFFVEAQYSRRKFSFVDSGSKYTDLIKGTLFYDRATGYRWNSPTFCGVCDDEKRDNEDILVKGSYFLSTDSMGSHDLVFGYDTFNDQRFVNNHQSGSDFRVYITKTIIGDDGVTLYPVFRPNHTYLQWNPILEGSKGTNFKTNSMFLNDKWRYNANWSFNVGLRYDKNDGKDSAGKLVAKDSRISPRVGATWDPRGDGEWIFNASFGRYVAAIANGVANDTSAAGSPATYRWWYRGDPINYNTDGPYVDADTALQMMWDWFFNVQGGTDSAPTRSIYIPGGTTMFPESLNSPYADEYAIGVSKRLGSRGTGRIDYVHRDYKSFYASKIDMETGQVTLPDGNVGDLAWIVNNDSLLERTYDGLTVQANYRLTDTFNLGGNYTLSRAYGNWNGETTSSGPVTSAVLEYPEYKQMSWYAPKGDLSIDQRHKLRFWLVYDIFNTRNNSLNVSVLQNFWSGSPYGAVGAIDPTLFIDNPGYEEPPDSVTYYYTAPDAYHTDDITRTDLSFNYAFKWQALGADMEIFIQPEILNLFNEQGAVAVNTTVYDPTDDMEPFNPFVGEVPVEGVNWEKGPNFGKPTNQSSYQTPRTFRVSVGFRF